MEEERGKILIISIIYIWYHITYKKSTWTSIANFESSFNLPFKFDSVYTRWLSIAVTLLSTMRSTLLRLAESVTLKPLNLRETSATLLPPKPYVVIHTQCKYSLLTTNSGCIVACYAHTVCSRLKCGHWETTMSKQVSSILCITQWLLVPQCSILTWLHVPEFRRHRSTTNPVHIIGFLSQWKMYLDELPATNFSGKKLDPTVFEKVCRLRRSFAVVICESYVYLMFVYAVDVCGTAGTALWANACHKGRMETRRW
jgi:hypothetical protein